MKPTNFVTRIRFISGVTLAFAVLLVGRLYSVQIVSGDEFANRAERQYLNTEGGAFDRGTIFFESKDGKEVPAAMLQPGFTVAISPASLLDAEEAYQKLS